MQQPGLPPLNTPLPPAIVAPAVTQTIPTPPPFPGTKYGTAPVAQPVIPTEPKTGVVRTTAEVEDQIDLIKEEFIIPNSYHILEKDLFRAVIDRFNNEKLDGLIPGIHEENIGEYGAFRLEGDRIKGIVEKPPAQGGGCGV